MKYENDLHLFSQKLSLLLKQKGMVNKKGEPDKIALYNALNPNQTITDEDCQKDRQGMTDKTRTVGNWIKGNNYPKNVSDVVSLCNALNCDLDYLFTDMDAPTHDLEFIYQYTGLSHITIEKIENLSIAEKQALNMMFDSYMKILLHSMVRAASFANHNGTITIQLESNMHTPHEENSQMPELHKELETVLNNNETKEMLIFQVHQDALDMVKYVLDNDEFKEQASCEFRKHIEERRAERNKAKSQSREIEPTIEFAEDGSVIE